MLRQLKNRHFYVILICDLVLFAAALFGAYMCRFDFDPAKVNFKQVIRLLPLIIPLKFVIFYAFGLYAGMWRYTSQKDLYNLIKAAALSSLIIFAVIVFVYRFEGFSRGVFVFDGILTLFFTGGIRLFIRMLYEKGFYGKSRSVGSESYGSQKEKRTLLIGAGDAGEKTFREIANNPSLSSRVIGFVDDAPSKKGRSIHGVPVLGKTEELPQIAGKSRAEELIIAIPSASGEKMRKIVEKCEDTGLPFKTLPGLGEIIDGRVSVKDLRDVDYSDLLGREPVELNIEKIKGYLHNQTVLVTGPGGSIGSELCRQIARHHPKQIILLDASEPNLYDIQMELEHEVEYLTYVPVLGSVQEAELIARVMERYHPQVVFHAAAYKHVPMLESNPWQAVWNNVQGTRNIMSAAVEGGVDKFILVSSDKAVRPTNVMGASKRCCERLMYAYTGKNTRFMAVRFGNVVGSAGSVVPLFRKQIARGGPVTVTHPEMTRYFMTIPEASQLILQAGAQGKGGELFVLEMGTPVRIADMAHDLIRLSGKEPGRDVEITYGKIRPGEKLYEELITDDEGVLPTGHDKIMVIRPNGCFKGFGGQKEYREWLFEELENLYSAAETFDADAVKTALKNIVPEYELQEGEGIF